MLVKGIASTTSKDKQGEFLDPSGFDLSNFQWLNWNHLGKDDPGKIIGEPTKAQVTANNELYIEGMLYPEVDAAKATHALMKALQNSPSGNKLSLSVEGKVLERGSKDPKNPLYNKVTKSRITAVALCPTPINGDTWVDLVTKGVTDDMFKSAEYDNDTKQILDIVEKPVEEVTIKELRKSDIYERIVMKYPDIHPEQATSVYNLILKVATMEQNKTVSDETLKKSFAILDLASEEIAKAEKKDDKKEEPKDDDEDKDMTEKAFSHAKEMKKSGMKKEEAKDKLIKKGYNEKVVEKALQKAESESEGWKQEGKNDKEEETTTAAREVKKSLDGVTDLIKAQDGKFKALGNIMLAQQEEIGELKKSLTSIGEENATLKDTIQKIAETPNTRKSVSVKSYSEKFEKSTDGKHIYNIASNADKKALRAKLHDLSELNKSEKFDVGLAKAAQNLELSGILTTQDVQLLAKHDIKVVLEK